MSKKKYNDWSWHWRSLSAVIYLLICTFDFLVMPAYREYTQNKLPVSEAVALAEKMDDSSAQIEALRILRDNRAWTPVTNEFFHLAFGAILGVAALPRNRRRSNPLIDGEEEEDLPTPRKGEEMEIG